MENDKDKFNSWLLQIHQQLAGLSKEFAKIYDYISYSQIEDNSVKKIKDDPLTLKNIVICMPGRKRHDNHLAMTDIMRIDIPKGYQIAGVVTEFEKTYSDARNSIIETALSLQIPMRSANGQTEHVPPDYLLWIDDDIIVPVDCVKKFVESNEDIISGVYYYKNPGHKAMNRYWEDGSPKYINEETVGIEKCDFLAPTGCLWMKTSVVNGLTRPYFEQSFPEDGVPHGYQFGEDRYFTEKCVQSGVTPMVHKEVQCVHVDVNTNTMFGNPCVVSDGNIILTELDKYAVRRFRLMQV